MEHWGLKAKLSLHTYRARKGVWAVPGPSASFQHTCQAGVHLPLPFRRLPLSSWSHVAGRNESRKFTPPVGARIQKLSCLDSGWDDSDTYLFSRAPLQGASALCGPSLAWHPSQLSHLPCPTSLTPLTAVLWGHFLQEVLAHKCLSQGQLLGDPNRDTI